MASSSPENPSSSPPSSTSSSFTIHPSFADLVPLYDGFILDQFGVMHNGSTHLPGADLCVRELATTHSKKLVILSNTSSSSRATLDKLPRLGFDPGHFLDGGAVTSGEEASRYIASTYGQQHTKNRRKKALWITWSSPRTAQTSVLLDFLSNCGDIDVTTNVDEADFILVHGSEVLRGPIPGGGGGEGTTTADAVADEVPLGDFDTKQDYTVLDPILSKAAGRKLPLVCANPDYVMVKPDGTIKHMPGKIAERYEKVHVPKAAVGKSGNDVECAYFGKPHVPHFMACIEKLGLPKNRIAHVGDSIHHDVKGANASGIDSIFVAGGIHRVDIGCDLGAPPREEDLKRVFDNEGYTPTHVVPLLKL